jgi:hypothetical protein
MMLTCCQSDKYNGFLDCASTIFKKEGFRGYFSGASMIFLQSITGATIYFMFDKIIKDLKSMDSF